MIRRAAFASSDGTYVDCHYGRANTFFVYDIGDEAAPSSSLVERRRCYRIPVQGAIEQGIPHHRDELERVAELLKDCDALFVVRIGRTPADFFLERGFRVFQLEARIDLVIEEISKENESERAERIGRE
jgi:predicted Fe-Mo cluster-binding NifX family protein